MQTGPSVSVRGWVCVSEALCALLIILSGAPEEPDAGGKGGKGGGKKGAEVEVVERYKVKTVRFWDCVFEPSDLLLLQLALPPSVTALAVDGCGDPTVANQTIGRFAPLFALPPTVSVLSLRCNRIDAEELKALLPALAKNPALTALSLWGNPLGDVGAKALASSLGALKHISLGNTRLGPNGAQVFGGKLADNTNLTSLDVSQNRVAEFGGALLGALKTNRALASLDLRCNLVTDEVQQLLIDEKDREDSGRDRPLDIGF
mmetsp:Transcript_69231/g.207690  ORF Transcript_69231/g.207690 Transcript_69231/m.207690 type:complete len:261 (+) Transcript_69231:490-1272(+)